MPGARLGKDVVHDHAEPKDVDILLRARAFHDIYHSMQLLMDTHSPMARLGALQAGYSVHR